MDLQIGPHRFPAQALLAPYKNYREGAVLDIDLRGTDTNELELLQRHPGDVEAAMEEFNCLAFLGGTLRKDQLPIEGGAENYGFHLDFFPGVDAFMIGFVPQKRTSPICFSYTAPLMEAITEEVCQRAQSGSLWATLGALEPSFHLDVAQLHDTRELGYTLARMDFCERTEIDGEFLDLHRKGYHACLEKGLAAALEHQMSGVRRSILIATSNRFGEDITHGHLINPRTSEDTSLRCVLVSLTNGHLLDAAETMKAFNQKKEMMTAAQT